MKHRLLFLMGLLLIANTPSESRADGSPIRTITYKPDQAIIIHGALLTVTQIRFHQNERILTIESGDSAAWMISIDPQLPHLLYIEPMIFFMVAEQFVIG